MLRAGELDGAALLEVHAAYAAIKPIAANGKAAIDLATMHTREDAQAQILLDRGPVPVIVLGGGRELTESLSRTFAGRAECIRVETRLWRDVSGSVPCGHSV